MSVFRETEQRSFKDKENSRLVFIILTTVNVSKPSE